MIHFSRRRLIAFVIFLISSMSMSVYAQVTYDDVVKGAIKKNNANPSQPSNNQSSVDQLLNNFYSNQYSDTNSVNQNTTNTPYNQNYNSDYNTPISPQSTTRQRSDVYDTPAGSRYRATQQQRTTPRVSANNPDAAWEAVKGSQPYGFKRKMTDLDEYSISEDDLLDATEGGVIDVNKIPDSRSTAQSTAPSGELCCPEGTSYFLGICTRGTINRNIRTAQYSEYSPGTKPPGGVCQGYKPIPGARVVNN